MGVEDLELGVEWSSRPSRQSGRRQGNGDVGRLGPSSSMSAALPASATCASPLLHTYTTNCLYTNALHSDSIAGILKPIFAPSFFLQHMLLYENHSIVDASDHVFKKAHDVKTK